MGSPPRTWVLGLVVLGFAVEQMVGGASAGGRGRGGSKKSCGFPAIYNFGDSNSDTGGRVSAFGQDPSPYGETFFGMPSGRLSDGRLVIDFIAEELGLPYLSAYLDSIGTNISHGANFAVAGSTIRPGGHSPFFLEVQISQFIHFKTRTTLLYKKLSKKGKSNLPRPEDFSRALYTFDMGQNDLALFDQDTKTTEKKVRASIPDILEKFSKAIQRLYKAGARVFWVHNIGPIGCSPFTVIYGKSKTTKLDKYGCIKSQNEVAKEFNKRLKDRVSELRAKLVHSAFTYIDVYSAKYSVISKAKKLGFNDPMKICCGIYGEYQVDCGSTETVNGKKVYGKPCADPSKYISWDGTHNTEATNKLIAKLIVNGSLSVPPVSLADACHTP
ncbi:hypothetical protein RHMOL_Rhmol08G0064800 [Rhododendron molle]|uniref:Uncharacterized protein n=1 Tax=Rhododendron molle TaxID=49168 RepID=A0ACC0MLU0_RHOML|nr:hypothetical protein RHMOL_Rhmol08G0064800 [Rhododendron molle]